MTEAKYKAEELILKYMKLQEIGSYNWFEKELGKKCAKIAVEEILNSRPVITDSQVEYSNYWKKVLKEIETL